MTLDGSSKQDTEHNKNGEKKPPPRQHISMLAGIVWLAALGVIPGTHLESPQQQTRRPPLNNCMLYRRKRTPGTGVWTKSEGESHGYVVYLHALHHFLTIHAACRTYLEVYGDDGHDVLLSVCLSFVVLGFWHGS